MSIDDLRPGPRRSRHASGLAALAVLVFAASAALFAQTSCTPTGATRTPEQRRQPEDNTPDPDPQTVDLSPPSRLRPAMT